MKLELESAYWKAVVSGLKKPRVSITPYIPAHRRAPERVLPVLSAWKGIESILSDLIERFDIKTQRCLEFGVEFGYSTAALSSFFDSVVGVDTFVGDRHTGTLMDIYADTAARLSNFHNIQLIRSDYRDWIKTDKSYYDLIHVDIIHTFADTFACGLWSAEHSKCAIFHDTESFPAVKKAVIEIARSTGKKFYNFRESNGLGILV
jgi:Methyltransferase domain